MAVALFAVITLAAASGAVEAEEEDQGPVGFGELRSSPSVRVLDLVGGGDVTGDGLADLLVGVREPEELGVGVRVVAGGRRRSSWVESIDDVAGIAVRAGRAEDRSVLQACPVGVVGDVNGDGVGELLLASCREVESLGRPLRAFVVFGSAEPFEVRLDALGDRGFEVVLERPEPGGLLRTVAAMEDVDGRGSAGFVAAFGPEVYDHRKPPPMSARVYRFDGQGGAEVWAEYSGSVAEARSAGDFDGDGRDDVVLINVAPERSSVLVVRTPDAADPAPRQRSELREEVLSGYGLDVSGNGSPGGFGAHGAGVGDFNGDGFDDVGFGQPNPPDSYSRDSIVLGGPEGASDVVLRPPRRSDDVGVPMVPVGDLDGDGSDDLLLPSSSGTPGRLLMVPGRPGRAEPIDVEGVGQPFALQAPANRVSDGFGWRSAVFAGDGGAPWVAALDPAGGTVYEFVPPPAVPRAGVAFDGDAATAQRVVPPPAFDRPASLAARDAYRTLSWRTVAGFGARRVVIASQYVFADALSAAPLLDGGVLLLGPRDGPTEELEAEVERVLSDTGQDTPVVFLIGGEAALSRDYDRGFYGIPGSRVRRVAGPSRVETSVEVARLVAELNGGGPVPRVGVARAYGTRHDESAGWVDSVTAGGWAADTNTPLLLTAGEDLHPAVAAAVEELGVTSSVVFGGVAAVREAAVEALPSPVRVAGSERAGTAAAIAEQLWPEGTTRRLLVNAYRFDGWQYGLPAAALSAESDAPLLLTADDHLPEATREALGCGLDPLLLGDERTIEAEVEAQILAETAC